MKLGLLVTVLFWFFGCIKAPESPELTPINGVDSPINSISLETAPIAFYVNGLSGITTGGLNVILNSGETKTITSDGVYVFETEAVVGNTFTITYDDSSITSERSCSLNILNNIVQQGSNSFEVNCAPANEYFVGGAVFGVTSNTLRVSISGIETKRVYSGESSFQFESSFPNGTYSLTISQQPTNLICDFVLNGANQTITGLYNIDVTVSSANISNIKILCSPPTTTLYNITLPVNGLTGSSGSLIVKDSRGIQSTVSHGATSLTLSNVPGNKRIVLELLNTSTANFSCSFSNGQAIWAATPTSNITGASINCVPISDPTCDVPTGDSPGTNGTYTASCSGDQLIYDGTFNLVGRQLGIFGLDVSQASPSPLPGGIYDRIYGTVNKIIRDPRGGWIVGGLFNRVGDRTVGNIVRFDNNFIQDTTFNVSFNDEISDLDVKDNTLFVTGAYSSVTVNGTSFPRAVITQLNLATTPVSILAWQIPSGLKYTTSVTSVRKSQSHLEDNYVVISSYFLNSSLGTMDEVLSRRTNKAVLRINSNNQSDFTLKITTGTINEETLQMALWRDQSDNSYWLVSSNGMGIFNPASPSVKHPKNSILGTSINTSTVVTIDDNHLYIPTGAGLKRANLSDVTPALQNWGNNSGGAAITETNLGVAAFDSTTICFGQKASSLLIMSTYGGVVCFDKTTGNMKSFISQTGDQSVWALTFHDGKLYLGANLYNPTSAPQVKPIVVSPQ